MPRESGFVRSADRREGTHLHLQVQELSEHGRVELNHTEAAMGMLRRNKSFLVGVGLILLAGLAIFGSTTAVLALTGTPGQAADVVASGNNYNATDSFGLTGMAKLSITPTAATPGFIKNPLKEKRGVILLVYVGGAAGDDSMLTSFRAVKAKYAASSSFYSFEAAKVTQLGDVIDQLGALSPPMLVIIRGDGTVYQLYTGWIDQSTMEQQVANAVQL
jgi:hypothetical protein